MATVDVAGALYELRCAMDCLNTARVKQGLGQYHLLRAESALVAALRNAGHDPGDFVASVDALRQSLRAECAPSPPLTVAIEQEPGPQTTLVLIQGGYPRPRDWPAYLESHPAPIRQHINAIRRTMADSDLDGTSSGRVFACSDGIRVAFTDNAWGDFRAALAGCGETFLDYR